MFILKKIALGFSLFVAAGIVNQVVSQQPTYVVDSYFSTGDLFSGGRGVQDFHFTDNNRILVGGGFINSNVAGFGMINSNGNLDQSWGYDYEPKVLQIVAQQDGYVYHYIYGFSKITLEGIPWVLETGGPFGEYIIGHANSPYIVKRVWDIYQMENGDLLLGGAIANDTLLPYTFRGISRIHADGSHDPTFPVLNITPNSSHGSVHKIFRAPDGAWYISGGFTAINGHETNRIARLAPDFEVDTTFVSPFVYDGFLDISANIALVDSQSRLWVSGYQMRLQENPNDTLQLIRLLPNGEVDETFLPRKLENIYPEGWIDLPCKAYKVQEIEAHPGNYFIYGSFSHFNDTAQPCITVVNDAGIIQNNFLQNQGATEHHFYINSQIHFEMPRIDVVKQRPDGSIFVGGTFAEFMGEERYSMVKLKPDSITATPREIEKVVFKVYPNPANTYIEFEYAILIPSEKSVLRILDVQGKPVKTWNLGTDQRGLKILDTRELINGVYFYELSQGNEKLQSGKFIIQH